MATEETGNAARLAHLRDRVRAYAEEAHARQVILLEMSGHVLAAEGGAWDDDVALGALLAGLFGSARELAAIFGEPEFRSLYQQGAHTGIYTVLIGDRWLLVTVFDGQSQIGLVRMLAGQVAADLARELTNLSATDLTAVRETIHSQAFRASFDDTLERLFHDDPISTSEER
jgi:predicted regulator of Ras-like GTPase activity (Roadblock/LC7/MglB family)